MALNLPIALMHVGSLYAVAAGAGTVLLVLLVLAGVHDRRSPRSSASSSRPSSDSGSVRFGWSLPEQRALGSWRVWRRA